jgi:hypothetical protein
MTCPLASRPPLGNAGRSMSHRRIYAERPRDANDEFASKKRFGLAHLDDARHADFQSKTWRWIEDGRGGFQQTYQLAQDGDLLTLQPLTGEVSADLHRAQPKALMLLVCRLAPRAWKTLGRSTRPRWARASRRAIHLTDLLAVRALRGHRRAHLPERTRRHPQPHCTLRACADICAPVAEPLLLLISFTADLLWFVPRRHQPLCRAARPLLCGCYRELPLETTS